MPRQKRQPAPHTTIIAFSIFCTSCADEIRVATSDDRNGDTEWCTQCGISVRTAVGVSVNANSMEEIKHTMNEMQKNLPLIHSILAQWNPSEDGGPLPPLGFKYPE